jgi:hypothetical protein
MARGGGVSSRHSAQARIGEAPDIDGGNGDFEAIRDQHPGRKESATPAALESTCPTRWSVEALAGTDTSVSDNATTRSCDWYLSKSLGGAALLDISQPHPYISYDTIH